MAPRSTWEQVGLPVPAPPERPVHLLHRVRKSDPGERDRTGIEQRVAVEDEHVGADEEDDSVIGSLVDRVDMIDLKYLWGMYFKT